MVYGLAFISAVGFALASVGQFRASRRQSSQLNMSFGLLGKLLSTPDFLWSIGFDAVGVSAQFGALIFGPISLVQPILALGLVLAVYLEHKIAKKKLALGELLACVTTALALGVFVAFHGISPKGSISTLWSFGIFIFDFIVSLLLLLQAKIQKSRLPVLLISSVAALSLGVGAVLEREIGLLLPQGIPHLLTSWQLWALVLNAPLTLLFVQSAFQLGELRSVLPILTVGEPIFALILGKVMVGESLYPSGKVYIGFTCLAVLIASLIYLARRESRFRELAPLGGDTDQQDPDC